MSRRAFAQTRDAHPQTSARSSRLNGGARMPTHFGTRSVSVVFIAALFASPGALDAQTLPQEYRTLMRSEGNVGALDAGLLGERIDYYTGHVDFVATDVSLPGHNALPVAVGRRYAIGA